jgi:UDP-glucose 4-epimerase
MNILVTGGVGFIGSHTLVELYKAGHTAVVFDNLSNSNIKALDRVEELVGKNIPFYNGDINDVSDLNDVFEKHKIDAVIHFAGLKAVGESVKLPWMYYNNNISGTLKLLYVMELNGCRNIIFSSSATVYGEPDKMPITEEFPKGQCTNPYGWTKSMIEQILTDIQKANNSWNVILLRYFNPIGAHPSGKIGENPNGIPNNLMPYITEVAIGKRKELSIFGDDYPTHDGTGVRDYIHVCDLAEAHVCALKKFEDNPGLAIYNIGTGHGYSVLDVVNTFMVENKVYIPYSIKERRAGDIAECWCDPSKAERELGWKAKYGLKEMVRDSWNWQQQNPNGYETKE